MPRSRSTASKASRPRRAEAAPSAVRTVEATGSSTRSWDAAVVDAVKSTKADAPKAVAVEIARLWADLDARSGIRQYRAAVKIAYPVTLVAPARPRRVASRAKGAAAARA